MNLTNAQRLVIKADIIANNDLNAQPATADGALAIAALYNAIAALYNAVASPDYFVWRSAMPTQEVFDAITWANLTPNDTPDGTQLWLNRAMACQGKQFNLQTILTGRQTIDPSKPNIRNGLQDALTNVPSGSSGNGRNAGWAALQLIMSRKATRLEKLFATGGNGSQATPGTLVIDGAIDYTDIELARAAT